MNYNSQAIEISLNSRFTDNPQKLLTVKYIKSLGQLSIHEIYDVVKYAPSCFYLYDPDQSVDRLQMRLLDLNIMGVDIRITKGIEKVKTSLDQLLTEAMSVETSSLRLQEILIIYYLCLSREDKLKDKQKIPKAIVSNPNTFFDLLCKLAVNYPIEFLQNPIVNFHQQINPNLLLQIPEITLESLIQTEEIPLSWIVFLLNNRRKIPLITAIKKYHRVIWQKWRQENPNIRII